MAGPLKIVNVYVYAATGEEFSLWGCKNLA